MAVILCYKATRVYDGDDAPEIEGVVAFTTLPEVGQLVIMPSDKTVWVIQSVNHDEMTFQAKEFDGHKGLILSDDEREIILQALGMLYSYYVADVESSDTIIDEQYELAAAITHNPRVLVDETQPDLVHATEIHEESNQLCADIKKLERKLGKRKGNQQ
jgi:hypothetical protein